MSSSSRQRRVDLHRLHGLGDLLGRRLVLQRPGIVQPVGNFDEDDADVLRHGHEHLAQIFHLLLFHGGILHARELCDALDEVCHRLAEQARDLLEARVGVLETVVQQRSRDGVGIEADLGHDLGHGQRMDDIRLARFAQLCFMFFVRMGVGLFDQLQVCARRIALNGLQHGFIIFLFGLH